MVRATGSYFDGQSAARQDIELELAHGGIRIVAARAGGLELAFWPYRELRLVDEPTGAGPWRIQAGNSPARLVIEDSTVAAAVWSNLGRTDARGPSWARLGLRWTVLSALSIAVLLAALWHGLPRVADEAARLVPRQWEAALGARMVRPLLQTLAPNGGFRWGCSLHRSRGPRRSGGTHSSPRPRRFTASLRGPRRQSGDDQCLRPSGGPDRDRRGAHSVRRVSGTSLRESLPTRWDTCSTGTRPRP